MTIKANIGQTLVQLNAVSVSTPLFIPGTGTRRVITAFSIHNVTAFDRAVDIQEDGTEVAVYSIAADSSIDVVEIIGQGYVAGVVITGTQTTGGAAASDLNAKITYTEYDGTSV